MKEWPGQYQEAPLKSSTVPHNSLKLCFYFVMPHCNKTPWSWFMKQSTWINNMSQKQLWFWRIGDLHQQVLLLFAMSLFDFRNRGQATLYSTRAATHRQLSLAPHAWFGRQPSAQALLWWAKSAVSCMTSTSTLWCIDKKMPAAYEGT